VFVNFITNNKFNQTYSFAPAKFKVRKIDMNQPDSMSGTARCTPQQNPSIKLRGYAHFEPRMPLLVNPSLVVEPYAKNISQLFSDFFQVPENQRDFAWKTKQIEQFFDDLFDHFTLISSGQRIANPQGYFIGSTVVICNDRLNASAPLSLVDGQQRSTVISIAAAVLSSIVEKSATPDVKEAEQYQAIAQGLRNCLTTYEGGLQKARLEFFDKDTNAAFQAFVISAKTRRAVGRAWGKLNAPQQKRSSPYFAIHDAYQTAYRKLTLFFKTFPVGPSRLQGIIEFIRMFLECVIVLQIKTFSVENTYAIFQSLNNRGLSLSQADLIKNELLRNAGSQRPDVVSAWQSAKEDLQNVEGIGMPELVHYSYLYRHGEAKAGKLYSTIKSKLSQGLSPKALADELAEDASALDKLANSRTWPHQINEYLDHIVQKLGHRFAYPILLAIHGHLYRNGRADDNSVFQSALGYLRNFLFRYMVVGSDASPETLAKIAAKIGEACRINRGDFDSILREISSIFLAESPDDTFEREFSEVSINKPALAYFAVSCLEDYLSQESGLQTRAQGRLDNNVEHILPQSPEAHWPEMAALKAANEAEFKLLLWKVGNLMPLFHGLNKQLQNKDIDVKVQHYEKTSLALAKNVATFKEDGKWTRESIAKRQKDLASIASKVWPLREGQRRDF